MRIQTVAAIAVLWATSMWLGWAGTTPQQASRGAGAVDLVEKGYAAFEQANPFVPVDWALRRYRGCEPGPKFNAEAALIGDTEAESLFGEALKRDPKDTEALLGLARVHIHFGEYEDAVVLCRRAVDAAPKDKAAQELLERATHLQSLKPKLQAAAPKGLELLRYTPGSFSRAGRRQIAAIYGRWVDLDEDGYTRAIAEARLAIFDDKGSSPTKLWMSGNILDSLTPRAVRPSGIREPEWEHCELLRAQDLTGDGLDDVAVTVNFWGGSGFSLRLCVFSCRTGSLREIFNGWMATNADTTPLLQDQDADGKWEVTFYYEIWGRTLCHAECPHWHDIYVYRNGKYVLDNWAFPHTYDKLYRELRTLLKEHPTDSLLWDYFARTCDLVGVPNEAKAARAKAKELRAPKAPNEDG
jgi:tetratricopeptide (TPR) repeat protein